MELAAASSPERLIEWTRVLFEDLRRNVAEAHRTMPAGLVLVIWNRLGLMMRTFQALIVKRAAGKLMAPRPRAARAAPAEAAEAGAAEAAGAAKPKRAVPASPLPRGRCWLLKLAPRVAELGMRVQIYLADPEIVALLEASPVARRLARALVRMMGTRAEPATAQALRRRPGEPGERKARPRKERIRRLKKSELWRPTKGGLWPAGSAGLARDCAHITPRPKEELLRQLAEVRAWLRSEAAAGRPPKAADDGFT